MLMAVPRYLLTSVALIRFFNHVEEAPIDIITHRSARSPTKLFRSLEGGRLSATMSEAFIFQIVNLNSRDGTG